MKSFQIAVTHDVFRMGYKLLAWRREADRLTIVSNIECTTYPHDEAPMSDQCPGVEMDQIGAQSLIDSLWDAGLRPTKGSGSAGSFEAQGKHLEDMRALVFNRQTEVLRKMKEVQP